MYYEITRDGLPECLRHIPSPPQQLYVKSNASSDFEQLMLRPRVAIVGSRKVSAYGQAVTSQLAAGLAAHGIVIISGLAFGVDAIAHRAALTAGGTGIAVLPGPVQRIQPQSHFQLADQLLYSGGALVSEYPADAVIYKPNFVARNRLVTGLADALLITEAAEKSGTLHTATFAYEQGVNVMVVPGNITSETSVGTNNLLKTGATPVTNVADIMHVIGLKTAARQGNSLTRLRGANPDEQNLINLLEQGIFDGHELMAASGLDVQTFNHNLTMLEISAKIRPLGANHWSLA